MQLVEIIFASDTQQKMLDHAATFVRKISRLPLPVKSSPGFLVNRILMPYIMEAVIMVEEGVAPEEIDEAALKFGMPMGPVELADVVGLDICNHVGKVLADAFNLPSSKVLDQKIEQGDKGKKTGKGFYEWKKGQAVKQKTTQFDQTIQDRLVLSYINEAVKCIDEDLVADADLLDAGMIFGTGFAPFRGGPMQYLRGQGAEKLHARLEQLSMKYGNRFEPAAGWAEF